VGGGLIFHGGGKKKVSVFLRERGAVHIKGCLSSKKLGNSKRERRGEVGKGVTWGRTPEEGSEEG